MSFIEFKNRILTSRNLMILTAIVPCVIFYIIFSYGPMGYALYLSFTNWTLGEITKFIKFGNYIKIITEDTLFYKALINTFYYASVSVSVGSIIALLLAVVINGQGRLSGVFRTIYFIPVTTSLVAISMVWKWLYQPSFGLLNQIIGLFNGPRLMWLQSPSLAMISVIIMGIWRDVGFKMVIFLAGLQGIPQTFYEAAMIDGANRVQVFMRITIPLLMPAITFVVVTGMIGALQVFTEMFVLMSTQMSGYTSGAGPLNSTRTIVVHLYERAFSFCQMGYASATAFVLFVIILILTIVQLHFLGKISER